MQQGGAPDRELRSPSADRCHERDTPSVEPSIRSFAAGCQAFKALKMELLR